MHFGQRVWNRQPGGGAGHIALEDDGAVLMVDVRHGRDGQKRLGVGVHGVGIELRARGDFHHIAQIHDRHPVADVLDRGQVVGNEQVGKPHLVFEGHHQVQDLRLNGHVQRGGRLVGDDDLGAERQGARHADALALSAGELVGEFAHVLALEAHRFKQLRRAARRLLFRKDTVDPQRLGDNIAHAHLRVQGRVRVLENHLDMAAVFAQRRAGQMGDILAVEEYLAVARGLVDLHQQPRQRGLSAAGFAHDADGFSPMQRKGNVVYGLDVAGLAAKQALVNRKVFLNMLYLQQCLAHAVAPFALDRIQRA